MIRIQLVDDHALFRHCVRDLIERQPDLCVVDESADAGAALLACARAASAALPHVVLMDLHMRGLDGLEGTRRYRARWPAVAVVALSSHDDPVLVRAFVAAGGRGYLLKSDPLADLLGAVRSVAAGGCCFSRSLHPSALPRAPPA